MDRGNTESPTKKVNNNRLYARQRSTSASLSRSKKEERFTNNSKLLKDENEKELDVPNSTAVVKGWLDDYDRTKHVQFSQNIPLSSKTKKMNPKSRRSASVGNHIPTSNLLPAISNDSTKSAFAPRAAFTASTFYRSSQNRRLSGSSITSSPITRSRSSSILSSILNEPHCSPSVASIEPPPSIPSSVITKNRFPSLEFNSTLSEFDRRKLDDIRQLIPDEFEKLLPILLKLGVIICPRKFFETNNDQMTSKEFIERHRLILLMKKHEDNIQYQCYIEDLYGSVLPKDDILHKQLLLREGLSLEGQLSLVSAYQDEIERELNKKIQSWKLIPMQTIKTSFSEHSFSTTRSFQMKQKSNSSNTDLPLISTNHIFQALLPDQIDHQWKRKSIANIIEQGMNLLDKVRLLSPTVLGNISSNERFIQDKIQNINIQNLVKAFKRWIFLWSTLFVEDTSLF